MTENDRLSGCLDEINLEFVEREATPGEAAQDVLPVALAVPDYLNIIRLYPAHASVRPRQRRHTLSRGTSRVRRSRLRDPRGSHV